LKKSPDSLFELPELPWQLSYFWVYIRPKIPGF
jgi:hypothetical protein